MAQRRMLSRRIAQSKKVNSLSLKAQLVWTWTIPFLDDYGRYTADAEDVKTEVFPKNRKITASAIKDALIEAQAAGLITLYKVDGEVYQQYNNFEAFQTFKSDRGRNSEFPAYKEGLETDGFQCIPASHQVKLSKDKLREVKLSKDKYGDFVLLTLDEYKKLIDKLGKSRTDELIEELNLGIGSKGYKYKSHYHTILKWAKPKQEPKESPQICTVDRKPGHKYQLNAKGEKVWLCKECVVAFGGGNWGKMPLAQIERVIEQGKKRPQPQPKKTEEMVKQDKIQHQLNKLGKSMSL